MLCMVRNRKNQRRAELAPDVPTLTRHHIAIILGVLNCFFLTDMYILACSIPYFQFKDVLAQLLPFILPFDYIV